MQNLEQIRSAAANNAAETEGNGTRLFLRADVAGFPALIMINGLLASLAYANDGSESRKGLKHACQFLAVHLANPVHGISVLSGATSVQQLLQKLGKDPATSLDLQRATQEALAYFGYLKRFSAKEQPRNNATAATD